MHEPTEISPAVQALAFEPWQASTERDHEDIRRVARRMAGRAEDGDDLAQEIWIEVLHRPPRRRDGILAWLQLLGRHAMGRLRRRDLDRRHRERCAALPEELASTLDDLEQRETRARIVMLVERLDEPYRSVVRMRYFEGLSVAEIAERTGRSQATVRSQIKRGLDRLRDRRGLLLG